MKLKSTNFEKIYSRNTIGDSEREKNSEIERGEKRESARERARRGKRGRDPEKARAREREGERTRERGREGETYSERPRVNACVCECVYVCNPERDRERLE